MAVRKRKSGRTREKREKRSEVMYFVNEIMTIIKSVIWLTICPIHYRVFAQKLIVCHQFRLELVVLGNWAFIWTLHTHNTHTHTHAHIIHTQIGAKLYSKDVFGCCCSFCTISEWSINLFSLWISLLHSQFLFHSTFLLLPFSSFYSRCLCYFW